MVIPPLTTKEEMASNYVLFIDAPTQIDPQLNFSLITGRMDHVQRLSAWGVALLPQRQLSIE